MKLKECFYSYKFTNAGQNSAAVIEMFLPKVTHNAYHNSDINIYRSEQTDQIDYSTM